MRIQQFPFIASILLSATLLFLVQPMVTRILLPIFGGSPAVWNTALVFFQVTLLCGYLYAYLISRLESVQLTVAVHGVVLGLPLLSLPAMRTDLVVPTAGVWPGLSVLAILSYLVGAPFFALSSNSSLAQHWFSQTELPGTDDPYWLYGASNLGSLAALIAYPLVVEQLFDLDSQLILWWIGYSIFAALTFSTMIWSFRLKSQKGSVLGNDGSPQESKSGPSSEVRRSFLEPVGPGRVFMWIARAAVGSSLLLSLTMRITTDVASVPLFWVVPLALYLVTFILAFSYSDRIKRRPVAAGAIVGIAASIGLFFSTGGVPFGVTLAVSLVALFFGALLCHHDIAADRPPSERLTAFYLWISAGGALGGILNSIVAPIVFDSVAEFPFTLVALTVLLALPPGARNIVRGFRPSPGLSALVLIALTVPFVLLLGELTAPQWLSLLALLMLFSIASARIEGLLLTLVLLAGILGIRSVMQSSGAIASERSFFGVVRVWRDEEAVTMSHGTTIHGKQSRDPTRSLIPMSYHHPEGPLGSIVDAQATGARIGILGLGTGALAAYAKPGQSMVFYEIDPLVLDMAREYFTFLGDSRSQVEVVIGDGRLELEKAPDRYFDVLVADAFSSDAIPMHLLTREAFDIYLSKVKSDGLVLLHISNRHLDLLRVVKGYSLETGAPVALADYRPAEKAANEGASPTVVVALSPDQGRLETLLQRPGWNTLDPEVQSVAWTDSRANILSVIK